MSNIKPGYLARLKEAATIHLMGLDDIIIGPDDILVVDSVTESKRDSIATVIHDSGMYLSFPIESLIPAGGPVFAVEPKPFTKSDLKDGMRVEIDGVDHYVCGGLWIEGEGDREYVRSNQYNDDLSPVKASYLTIDRVTDRDGTVLFERKPEKRKVTLELTEEQEAQIKKDLGL